MASKNSFSVGYMKRKIVLKIPENVSIEKFIDEIMGSVSAQFVNYNIKGNTMELTLVGDPASITRSMRLIKKTLSEIQMEKRLVRKNKIIVPKNLIGKILGYPLSLDLLRFLLQIKQIDYDETMDEIVIYEDIEKLRVLASDLFKLYKASEEFFSGKAREIASIIALELGEPLSIVLEIGVSKGVFKKDEDGKARLAINKENAIMSFFE